MTRHLLVDARAVRARPTGIGNAVLRQLAGINGLLAREDAPPWRVTALRLSTQYGAPGFRELWASLDRIGMIETDADPTVHPSADWWLHCSLPRLIRRIGADVYYGPAYAVPRRGGGAARMVMFHDDLAWTSPESYPWRFRRYIRWQMALSARHADRFLFPSRVAMKGCAGRLGLRRSRCAVVPHGVSPSTFRTTGRDVKGAVILCVASSEARKNQIVLAEALRGRHDLRLVLVGYTPGDAGQLRGLMATGAPVEIVPTATEAEVAGWFARASALALPTLGEGFGFPVIEAMAAGVPLLLSDIPVMREVAGDAAIYLPPGDPAAWGRAVDMVLGDRRKAEDLAALGRRRVRRYTLERCAARLLCEAEKALAARRGR